MPSNTDIQHQLILRLLLTGAKTLRELAQHNILSPGKRISELIEMGFAISKQWIDWIDGNGVSHRVMQYVYLSSQNDLNEKGEKLKKSL